MAASLAGVCEVSAQPYMSAEAAGFVTIVRAQEKADRESAILSWRLSDMCHARDWKEVGRETGIDTREDIKRNVRYARHWNHMLIRMRIARKTN
jgi:hypothetical protein